MSHANDNARNRRVTHALGLALKDVFVGTANLAFQSVTKGSELTAAPGQPVDTGDLLTSWQLVFDGSSAIIGTNSDHALPVEDAVGPHGPVHYGAGGHGRSTVGGSHSVKLTDVNFDRILTHEMERAAKAPHE